MADPRKTSTSVKDFQELRKARVALVARVKRNEERIEQLERETARLDKENQRLRTQRKNRKVSGFHILCACDPDYHDIWESPVIDSNSSGLVDLEISSNPSGVQHVSLCKHVWTQSEIIPEKDYDEKYENITDDEDLGTDCQSLGKRKDGSRSATQDDHSGLAGSGSNDGNGIRTNTPAKTETDREQYVNPERRRLFEAEQVRSNIPDESSSNIKVNERKRRLSSITTGDSAQSPAFQRKSVCVHCWQTSALCDFEAQCRNCRLAKVTCIRKLCDDRSSCINRRCPRLHPGEWDGKNTEWIVEEGHLPWRGKGSDPWRSVESGGLPALPRRRMAMDLYRPVYEDGQDPRRAPTGPSSRNTHYGW